MNWNSAHQSLHWISGLIGCGMDFKLALATMMQCVSPLSAATVQVMLRRNWWNTTWEGRRIAICAFGLPVCRQRRTWVIIRQGVHLTLFCLNVVTSQQLQNFVWKGYKKLYNWSMRIKGGVQPHCPTVQKELCSWTLALTWQFGMAVVANNWSLTMQLSLLIKSSWWVCLEM